MSTLFLIEDNESLGSSLTERLGQEGYQVILAKTFLEAKEKLPKQPVDLAIVDVSLPDGSGIDFARSYLKPAKVPIVFLSAFSTAEYRLEGFDVGAADYIPKPFHLRELLLRVKRVLENSHTERVQRIGTFTVNFDSRSITTENGESQFLPQRDFELLQFLLQSAPRVVSRAEIVEKVWNEEGAGNQRTVDNAIVRLRQALGDDGHRIRSVRGVGYQWVDE